MPELHTAPALSRLCGIFIVGVEESSHSLQSSRELVQIIKVSVQICTPQVRSRWNPDVFLSKLKKKR